MGAQDEYDFLLRAQRGDKHAFGELVRRQQSAVFNVAYRILGRRRDAEDAAQEAFLRAYRALEQFDLERPFAPWVKRICVNVCLNWLEAQRIRPYDVAADLPHPSQEWSEDDQWARTNETPEKIFLEDERSRLLRQAIWSLPPHFRAVIELRHFQGLSYAAIGRVMDRPLSSVKSDLFRARKRLADLLAEGQEMIVEDAG